MEDKEFELLSLKIQEEIRLNKYLLEQLDILYNTNPLITHQNVAEKIHELLNLNEQDKLN